MYGRGISDDCVFIDRALETIREFTADDGQQFIYRKFIAPSAATVSFAKALNRSVTGSMNELVEEAKCCLLRRHGTERSWLPAQQNADVGARRPQR